MESTKLPPELKKNFNKLQDGIKQWSQFVAWSWSNDLAFLKEEQENQEKELKDYFINTLQAQARYSYAVNSYGDDSKKPDAYRTSSNIKKLLLGKNDKIEDLKPEVKLTLPQVYKKLTDQSPKCLSDETFMKQFHVEIVTDKFSGSIRDALHSENLEIKELTGEDVQYIIYLTYPPCPAFSKATVTEDQLKNWMRGKNENGEDATDYLPPSAYIPVSYS